MSRDLALSLMSLMSLLFRCVVVNDSPFNDKTRDSNGHGILNSASSNGANPKKTNKRTHRIIELYETEKRFVNILHSIIFVRRPFLVICLFVQSYYLDSPTRVG